MNSSYSFTTETFENPTPPPPALGKWQYLFDFITCFHFIFIKLFSLFSTLNIWWGSLTLNFKISSVLFSDFLYEYTYTIDRPYRVFSWTDLNLGANCNNRKSNSIYVMCPGLFLIGHYLDLFLDRLWFPSNETAILAMQVGSGIYLKTSLWMI